MGLHEYEPGSRFPGVIGRTADRSEPATEVGGDYFDYLRLENGNLAVVVGDVAGHGSGRRQARRHRADRFRRRGNSLRRSRALGELRRRQRCHCT